MIHHLFIKRLEYELKRNNNHGQWEEWHPSQGEALVELHEHTAKLHLAIKSGDRLKIQEHAADVSLICEKIFTEFTSLEVCCGCEYLTNDGCTFLGIPNDAFSPRCYCFKEST